jgi:hypothetical protein
MLMKLSLASALMFAFLIGTQSDRLRYRHSGHWYTFGIYALGLAVALVSVFRHIRAGD